MCSAGSFAAERPPIVPRAAWAARPPDVSLMKRQMPRGIVVHHTGEKSAPQLTLGDKLQKLQNFARSAGRVGTSPKPPWGDLPYHFYIDASGRIGEGRSLAFAGDSNTAYDTSDLIQIVLEGHFNVEQPAPAQLIALDRLVTWLAARYRIRAEHISGHSDHVGGTECPGEGLKRYLPDLRSKVAKARTTP